MTVHELLESYKCGESTWTKHGRDGLAPNTEQYDLNSNAEHHITINYNDIDEITGVHYTIRNQENTLFHLHYYKDQNKFIIDFSGTRNPKTINIQDIKSRLAAWCVVSQYAINANQGNVGNLTAFQDRIKELDKSDVPQGRKTKRGMVLDLTGGGRRY
jgi:hypothetical protein